MTRGGPRDAYSAVIEFEFLVRKVRQALVRVDGNEHGANKGVDEVVVESLLEVVYDLALVDLGQEHLKRRQGRSNEGRLAMSSTPALAALDCQWNAISVSVGK